MSDREKTLRDIVRDLAAQVRAAQVTLDELHDEMDAEFGRGRPDFVLKATDRIAPQIVADWIELAKEYAEEIPAEKVERAQRRLGMMLEWQERNPDKVKWPD